METYLRHFTRHTEYNISDFGVSYLDRELPEDLAGRVIRDCGVYAVAVAYEVYRTARHAVPPLHLDFTIYSMLAHVVLVISDRARGNHYLVDNDRITGPFTGDVLDSVARAYARVSGRRAVIGSAARVPLGSTSEAEARFRSAVWRRYRASSRWGLAPVTVDSGEAGATENQRREQAYAEHYRAVASFDAETERVHDGVEALLRELQSVTSAETRRTVLLRHLPSLFERAQALRVLLEGHAIRLPLVTPTPSFFAERIVWLLTSGREDQPHALLRIARALLYFEGLGGSLSAEQAAFVAWVGTLQLFRRDLASYLGAGRPPAF
jgi:hypothetical protein